MRTPDPDHPRLPSVNANSLTIRSIIVGVLVLIMLVPLVMVEGVVNERSYLYDSVLEDIASTWGQPQTLTGPLLVVPFTHRSVTQETITDKEGNRKIVDKERLTRHQAVFLPKEIDASASIQEEFRERGIYRSLVYTSDIRLNSKFSKPDIQALSDNAAEVHFDKAFLVVGLSDTRAINSVTQLEWNGQTSSASPGSGLTDTISHGFHVKLGKLKIQDHNEFSLEMNINGSSGFRFAPLGETTRMNISSSWPHPSFQGSILPSHREINADGFTAQWEIPHLARHYPQSWDATQHSYNLYSFATGVDMYEPISLYSQIERAVKYGILFIGLTFLTFLIFELTIGAQLHFVQYALVGISLSLFFLVLLSLSEHIPFIRAYGIGSAITIMMITTYIGVALNSFVRASIIFVLLVSLYIVLYSLLQLEDYALLMGTGLLLLVVMVLMFVTRNLGSKELLLSSTEDK